MLKEMNHTSGTQQAGVESISAHGMSDHSMKRTYFPGIVDTVVVTDPKEIRTISNDARFDRDFIRHGLFATCSFSIKYPHFLAQRQAIRTSAAAHRPQPSRRARRTVVETKRQGRPGETRTR